MINIIAICQLYKHRELQEIQWINRANNLANVMTKSNPNKAFKKFLDTNCLRVQVEG
jgi:hypothetical protein